MNTATRITLSNGQEIWLNTRNVEVEQNFNGFGNPMSLDVQFSAYAAPWMNNCFNANETFKVSQILFLINGERMQIVFSHCLGIITCNLYTQSYTQNDIVDMSISGAGYFKKEGGKLLT